MVDKDALMEFTKQLKNDSNYENGIFRMSKELAYEISEIIERVLDK